MKELKILKKASFKDILKCKLFIYQQLLLLLRCFLQCDFYIFALHIFSYKQNTIVVVVVCPFFTQFSILDFWVVNPCIGISTNAPVFLSRVKNVKKIEYILLSHISDYTYIEINNVNRHFAYIFKNCIFVPLLVFIILIC